MKTTKLFGWILTLGCILSLNCQAQQIPFIGTIQYRISYQSEIIPQEQLAQSPQIATLRMGTTKAIFSMSEEKTLADAETKTVYSLINLSQLGLGKYRIETSEAELKEDDGIDIKLEATGQTKEIFGYTAQEVLCRTKIQGASVEINAWCVADFCDPFLIYTSQADVPGLPGFPIEYTITTPDISMTFNVHKLTTEEVNPKYFSIPASYKLSTKEKMAADIQEAMQALQGLGM